MGTMDWSTALTKPVQNFSRCLHDWIRTQFAALSSGHVLASIPAFVWQPRQQSNADYLVPLLRFLWSGFVELSVNNSSIAFAIEFELNCRHGPDVASVRNGVVIGVVVSAKITLAQIAFLLWRQL